MGSCRFVPFMALPSSVHDVHYSLTRCSVVLSVVVYLMPHETSYVEFLRVRKIPLQQLPVAQLPEVQPELQRQAETDR